jgi:hypothetical protein
MPQLQNLVLTDRESTPVDHTFTPRDIVNGVGTVTESSGVPIGDNRFSVSLASTSSGKRKAILKGVFPVVQDQTINGITEPTVVRTAYATFEFTFDEKSTEAERDNVVGMMMDSLDPANVLVNDLVVKLQGVY